MAEAFIIMQIGNADLDRVCGEAIVPALKECGMDPKRVDKHNEGGLLKSEIVGFIRRAEIIVADLTNERPNCYLEVGYAMGLEKNRSLILTAREDHNPSSPNYRPDRQKIHFDLAGYDVLFWHPERIQEFRAELIKRIQRRRAITAPSAAARQSTWDVEWAKAQAAYALEKSKKIETKTFMEIQFALSSPKPEFSLQQLRDAAKNAPIHTFGWPIGVVLENRDDCRPYPREDGIAAEILAEFDRRSFDYWALRRNGDFYLLKSLFEDQREPGVIFWDTRVVRTTESLMYCARLYNLLGVPAENEVNIRVSYSGLSGRILSVANRNRIMSPVKRQARVDECTAAIQVSLNQIEAELPRLVKGLTRSLFELFDFFEVSDKIYEEIVQNFVRGRV